MPDQAKPVSRPWRRYLRFSVRGLIVLVLVIGGGLGWIVRSARIQRNAVAAIYSAGGFAAYDWEWSNGKLRPEGERWAPRWLVDLIGIDYVSHVNDVWLPPTSLASDALLEQAGRLVTIERLYLASQRYTDAGLAHFRTLTHLSELHLSDSRVTDAGLAHLTGLTNLSKLDLKSTRVTDAGLPHLIGLTKLSLVDLTDTQVTDAGVKELQQSLPSLKIKR